MEGSGRTLLEVNNLQKYFPIQRGFFRRTVGHVRAVDGVNFSIAEGETLGLVGESGCGKTTLGRCIVRAFKPTSGQILYYDDENFVHNIPKLMVHIRNSKTPVPASDREVVDFALLSGRDLKAYRKEIQMIFQDPFSSLNPRMTVLDIVGEPLQIHQKLGGEELRIKVADLLRRVGLKPQHMNRYPNAFSGGQRQRIGIARALALKPKLVVCDEPVSALDVSIQAQVINLLKDLQREFGLTYLFIAHDLAVVEHISDRVAVMYLGRMVEMAKSDRIYHMPRHPYTEALLSAVPTINPHKVSERIILSGDVPNPANPPSGCAFHPRCRYAVDLCKQKTPEWRNLGDAEGEHWVACHRAEELQLIAPE